MRMSSRGRSACDDHRSISASSLSTSSRPLPFSILTKNDDTLFLNGVILGSVNQSPSVYASLHPGLRTLYHSETTFSGSGTVQSM